MAIEPIFLILALIVSVVIHEVSHGFVADFLGDPTARLAGRLTLNPLRHLDFVGSFLVPAILVMLGGLVFGWAKPVPYNPYNLRAGRFGPAYVAAAGPAANLLIAAFFSLLLRFGGGGAFFGPAVAPLFALIVWINVLLALFNLVPIAPLDGSKILFALLPFRWREVENFLNRHQLVLLAVLILVLINTDFLLRATTFVFRLLVGPVTMGL